MHPDVGRSQQERGPLLSEYEIPFPTSSRSCRAWDGNGHPWCTRTILLLVVCVRARRGVVCHELRNTPRNELAREADRDR
jgi:hypothetical protein